MVKLPDEFIATRYPGYFFNTSNDTLYSLKVSGVLRPLPLHKPCHWNRLRSPAFRISVKGRRRIYPLDQLKTLAENDRAGQEEVIPVQE